MTEVLSAPDTDDYSVTFADWVEFNSLLLSPKPYQFSDLTSIVVGGQEKQPEDIAEGDEEEEDLKNLVITELLRRRDTIGENYPFSISEDEGNIRLRDTADICNHVYLFCLILSHATGSPILLKDYAPSLTNRERDLFQVCATAAAAGLISGEAYSFGHPRPDVPNFLLALREIYSRLGDGTPVATWPAGVSVKVKDDGIDIIGWRAVSQRSGGVPYLLGQAATGVTNWEGKDLRGIVRQFHESWFNPAPVSDPMMALFIPFHPITFLDGSPSYSEAEHTEQLFRRLRSRFGTVVWRYVLPGFTRIGMQLASDGVVVERIAELADIRVWVIKYLEVIRREALA